MEGPGNVGVMGRSRLLESQNIDSRLVTGKFPGMCELRDKIAPWETLDSKIIQVRLEPPPARRWRWFASSLIIRGDVKDFAADYGVRHCSVWRYDLFASVGQFLSGHALNPAPSDPPDADQAMFSRSPFVVGPHGRIGKLRPSCCSARREAMTLFFVENREDFS
jgi:hypothetical protein